VELAKLNGMIIGEEGLLAPSPNEGGMAKQVLLVDDSEFMRNLLREILDAIIQNYATVYEGQLQNLQVMKDLYLSCRFSREPIRR
jgi:PleD family two-component response regulator